MFINIRRRQRSWLDILGISWRCMFNMLLIACQTSRLSIKLFSLSSLMCLCMHVLWLLVVISICGFQKVCVCVCFFPASCCLLHPHVGGFQEAKQWLARSQSVCMCVCVWVVDWKLHVCFRMWNWVLQGWAQDIHLHFGKGVTIHGQSYEVFCFQSFVPRALFRIVAEPRTASNSSSFVMIFPRMVFNISEILLHHSHEVFHHHWNNFGILQLPGSFHFLLVVLVFGHFLDFCIVSAKSPALTPQLAMPSSLFFAPK